MIKTYLLRPLNGYMPAQDQTPTGNVPHTCRRDRAVIQGNDRKRKAWPVIAGTIVVCCWLACLLAGNRSDGADVQVEKRSDAGRRICDGYYL